MNKIVTLVIALSFMSLALVAQHSEQNTPMRPMDGTGMRAQQNHPNHDMTGYRGPQGRFDHMDLWRRLDLNRSQYAQVTEMVENHRDQQNRKHEAIGTLRLRVHRAIMEERWREAKRLNTQISRLQREMADARIDHLQGLMRVLTPEQKREALRILGKPRERMECGMNRPDDRPGHPMNGTRPDCDDCDDCGEHQQQNREGRPRHRAEQN